MKSALINLCGIKYEAQMNKPSLQRHNIKVKNRTVKNTIASWNKLKRKRDTVLRFFTQCIKQPKRLAQSTTIININILLCAHCKQQQNAVKVKNKKSLAPISTSSESNILRRLQAKGELTAQSTVKRSFNFAFSAISSLFHQ